MNAYYAKPYFAVAADVSSKPKICLEAARKLIGFTVYTLRVF